MASLSMQVSLHIPVSAKEMKQAYLKNACGTHRMHVSLMINNLDGFATSITSARWKDPGVLDV